MIVGLAGLTLGQLGVLAGAVFFAAVVQVVAGFGFGLLSVPLMALVIPTRDAVVVSSLVGLSVSAWQSWNLRAHCDRTLFRRLTAWAYVGMPFGLWVFVAVDDRVLRLLLGIAVLIAVAVLARGVELHHVGRGLEAACGFVSGVLNTSLSTNGPPLVFALQARRLDADRFRGTIQAVFIASNVFALALFVGAGKVHVHGLVAAAVALPAMALGQLAGHPLRRHVHGERFRWLVLALLTGAAASAIVAALR
jgi:uncharacterized protein